MSQSRVVRRAILSPSSKKTRVSVKKLTDPLDGRSVLPLTAAECRSGVTLLSHFPPCGRFRGVNSHSSFAASLHTYLHFKFFPPSTGTPCLVYVLLCALSCMSMFRLMNPQFASQAVRPSLLAFCLSSSRFSSPSPRGENCSRPAKQPVLSAASTWLADAAHKSCSHSDGTEYFDLCFLPGRLLPAVAV